MPAGVTTCPITAVTIVSSTLPGWACTAVTGTSPQMYGCTQSISVTSPTNQSNPVIIAGVSQGPGCLKGITRATTVPASKLPAQDLRLRASGYCDSPDPSLVVFGTTSAAEEYASNQIYASTSIANAAFGWATSTADTFNAVSKTEPNWLVNCPVSRAAIFQTNGTNTNVIRLLFAVLVVNVRCGLLFTCVFVV